MPYAISQSHGQCKHEIRLMRTKLKPKKQTPIISMIAMWASQKIDPAFSQVEILMIDLVKAP
jgi:hypothetical protein